LGKEIEGLIQSNKACTVSLTNEQLDAELPIVEQRVGQKRERVENLKSSTVVIDSKERNAMEQQREKYRKVNYKSFLCFKATEKKNKAWRVRKGLVMKEILPGVRDMMPFDDELIEKDEDAGADFNNSAVDRFYREAGGGPPPAGNPAQRRAAQIPGSAKKG
jgi:hypothetical protein